MNTYQDSLVMFSAGNAGPMASTIGDGGTAKNDLTVGASGNNRPSDKFASDPNLIVSFSSRGPNGGMFQPDIMAPGEYIVSLHATNHQQDPDDQDLDGNVYNDPFCMEYTKVNEYPDTPDTQWDYATFSGTSMACPAAAGVTALARQYYTEIKGVTPSGMLMKATMINGALDMGFGFPSNDQGWGRINIKESVFPDAPATWRYHDNTTGIAAGTTWNSTTYFGSTLNIASNRVPLKVTLTWLDTSGNNGAIQNNMNLRVIGPNGLYLGNIFSGAWSVQGGTADAANLVEKVMIQAPVAGNYWIEVPAITTPGGARPFAIVMSGDFGAQAPYQINMKALSPVVFSCVAGGSTTFNYNLLNFGTNYDSIQLSESGLPSGVSVTYSTAKPGGSRLEQRQEHQRNDNCEHRSRSIGIRVLPQGNVH